MNATHSLRFDFDALSDADLQRLYAMSEDTAVISAEIERRKSIIPAAIIVSTYQTIFLAKNVTQNANGDYLADTYTVVSPNSHQQWLGAGAWSFRSQVIPVSESLVTS